MSKLVRAVLARSASASAADAASSPSSLIAKVKNENDQQPLPTANPEDDDEEDEEAEEEEDSSLPPRPRGASVAASTVKILQRQPSSTDGGSTNKSSSSSSHSPYSTKAGEKAAAKVRSSSIPIVCRRVSDINDDPGIAKPDPPHQHQQQEAGYESTLLCLLVGPGCSRPIYYLFQGNVYLIVSLACMVLGLVIGTWATTRESAYDSHFILFTVLILPLHLQRLLLLDYRILHHLLGDFEALFILGNWMVIFPCLGRVLGLGWKLMHFCLVTLAALPSLLSDASRDSRLRNILALMTTMLMIWIWIFLIESEVIPGALYDKPLLLLQDNRFTDAVGPASAVLVGRLVILLIFSCKYLINLCAYPKDLVLLRVPRRRVGTEELQVIPIA